MSQSYLRIWQKYVSKTSIDKLTIYNRIRKNHSATTEIVNDILEWSLKEMKKTENAATELEWRFKEMNKTENAAPEMEWWWTTQKSYNRIGMMIEYNKKRIEISIPLSSDKRDWNFNPVVLW